MKENFNFISTGIGSLPYTDAVKAVEMIFKHCPSMPFWPQLPRLSRREDMVVQFSPGIPYLKENDKGVCFDHAAYSDPGALEVFYQGILDGKDDFLGIDKEHSAGLVEFIRSLEKDDLSGVSFIKCHVTGPFTFAASFNDVDGKSLLHNEVMMDVVVKALAAKAKWQIRLFKRFNKPIVVFFDEPFLSCFGSAFTAVSREDVERVLGEVFGVVRDNGAYTGIHCCGNTDWAMLMDIESLDIVNFDAFGFFEKFSLYTDNISRFLRRLGAICWGIVPTLEYNDKITPRDLVLRLKGCVDSLAAKGIDRDLLCWRSLISPSCGLGSLPQDTAEKVLSALSAVSETMRSGEK